MATNLKAKKKKGTYDNKIILWISVALAVFVGLVVGIYAIVTYSTNYVAKVDGEKIYTYEYNHFLRQALSESFEEPEGYEDMSSEEKDEAFRAYFTEEVQKECAKTALEEARKFNAQYLLAKDAGFKLTSEEKANVKSSIDYYYSMYVSSYGLSEEMAEMYVTGGGMELDEYKDFSLKQQTIEKYKNHLKEAYKVTTEEMKEIYDKEPNDYRTIAGRVYKFAIPTKPTVPKDEDGKEITAEAAEKDQDLKTEYDKYLEKKAEYDAKLAHYTKQCEDMLAAINAGEKFTLYDYEYDKDSKSMKIKKDDKGEDVVLAKDADFEALCALSAWASASSNKGVISVGAGQTSEVDEIDELLLRAQWADEKRLSFIFEEVKEDEKDDQEDEKADDQEDASAATSSTSSEQKDEDEKDEAKVTPSALQVEKIYDEDGETLTGLYLVRVENIDDFDTEVAEDAEEGELNTVQTGIKSTILEDKAVAELDEMIEKAGKTYAVESKKQDAMDDILKEVMKDILG